MNATTRPLYWMDPPGAKNTRRHVSDGSTSLCRNHRYRDTTAPLSDADRAAAECPAGVCVGCWRAVKGLPERPNKARKRGAT